MNEEELQHLGSFQLENLVKNRVPFILVHFNQDFSQVFNSFYAGYAKSQAFDAAEIDQVKGASWLENISQQVKQKFSPESVSSAAFEHVEQKLRERGLSKESALVFLCENGKKSRSLFRHFWLQGYGNAFWIKDGMQAVRRDLIETPQN